MKVRGKVLLAVMALVFINMQPITNPSAEAQQATSSLVPPVLPSPTISHITLTWSNIYVAPAIQTRTTTVFMCSTDMVNWTQFLSCPWTTAGSTNVAVTNQPLMFFRAKNVTQ